MDAHDIFIKITRNAIFTKKKKKKLDDNIKTEKTIKVEPDFEDNPLQESTNTNRPGTIQILGDIVAAETATKTKKRKLKTNITDEVKQTRINQENINRARNLDHINVVGCRIAEPINNFQELKTDQDLIENLIKCGYTDPTPIQKQAIPIMLENRQLLACAPTGSGKTAAFLLPIIHALKEPKKEGFRGLVICPTRELAKQTQRECLKLAEGRGLKIHVISKVKQAQNQYGTKSSKKFDILITTPNRLCYLLNLEDCIKLTNIEWLIIDEADKLFEDGPRSFREQLNQILLACSKTDKKIAMFSATYTPLVAKWCNKNMKQLIRVTVGQRNTTSDLVSQELLFVGNESGKLIAFRELVRNGLSPPVLVFVQSKERAQELFGELIYDGINVDAIHADRTQLQRDNTVRAFREGRIWVLICTELMARGVDFKGVNLVVNYDFPPSAIAYVHRVGRAGRAGRTGKAITFFTSEDTVNLRSIANVLKQSGCEIPDYMLAMKKHSKKEMKRLKTSAVERDSIKSQLVVNRNTLRKFKGEDRDKEKRKGKGGRNRRDKVKNGRVDKKLVRKQPMTGKNKVKSKVATT